MKLYSDPEYLFKDLSVRNKGKEPHPVLPFDSVLREKIDTDSGGGVSQNKTAALFDTSSTNTDLPARVDLSIKADLSTKVGISTTVATTSSNVAAFTGVRPLESGPMDKEPLVEHLDRVLNLLDKYQMKLGNPTVSVMDMGPMIGRLENENKTLASLINSLEDADELKDMANQVLVTSLIEIEKYKRGDYLSG